MFVAEISAFSMDNIELKLIIDSLSKTYLIENIKKYPLEQHIRGKIIDKQKALVGVGSLIISLQYDFEKGFPNNLVDGDFIEFKVDRLDCILK